MFIWLLGFSVWNHFEIWKWDFEEFNVLIWLIDCEGLESFLKFQNEILKSLKRLFGYLIVRV